MRAFEILAARTGAVLEVDPLVPLPGQAIVDIERVGLCGTDVELYSGEMAYLRQGHASYPLRPGHEWSGTVTAVGDPGEARWVGRRVTGDPMLGCGLCDRCYHGRQHVCAERYEVGVRGGWPGALASQLAAPTTSLHELPDGVDSMAGALVEPGANALRAVLAADLAPGERVLIIGAGTVGLLTAMFASAIPVEVHMLGRSAASLAFARDIGFQAWDQADLPTLPFDAVIDASNGPGGPALALELVEPGRRVVLVGLAPESSLVDTRAIALMDVVVVGILGGSSAIKRTIEAYATGTIDPRPLVATTVGLDAVTEVLGLPDRGRWGRAPKVHVDPRR